MFRHPVGRRAIRLIIIGLALGHTSLRSSQALAFRSPSTDNEWHSPETSGLATVGHMAENPVDRFFADPSLMADDNRTFVLQFLGLGVSFSDDVLATQSEFQEILSSRENSSGTNQTVALLDSVRSAFGRNLTGGLNLALFAMQIGRVSIIPYTNALISGAIDVPALPAANLVGDVYGGLGLGYGHAFGKKKEYLIGLGLRPGVRAYADIDASLATVGDIAGASPTATTTSTTDTSSSELMTLGMGFYVPVDLSFAYRPLPKLRVNMVARNMGGSRAYSTIEGEAPPTYPTRLSLGGSYEFYNNKMHTITAGTDFQDLLGVEDLNTFLFRWQMVAQYKFRFAFREQTSFALSAGLREGFPAVGILLDLFAFKLDYAYYARERGYRLGQRPETLHSFRLISQLTF